MDEFFFEDAYADSPAFRLKIDEHWRHVEALWEGLRRIQVAAQRLAAAERRTSRALAVVVLCHLHGLYRCTADEPAAGRRVPDVQVDRDGDGNYARGLREYDLWGTLILVDSLVLSSR